jgi:hypothetical protein
MTTAPQYLIWSNEHGRWWKPWERGYTCVLSEAGRYPLKRATEICENANIAIPEGAEPSEVLIPAPEAMTNPDADLQVGYVRYRLDVHHNMVKHLDQLQATIGLGSHLDVIQKALQHLTTAFEPSLYIQGDRGWLMGLKITSPDLSDKPG